ncbi:MAG TPA: rhamnogalacturonan acetylesterase [Chitinophagaceae bacterium]|nr:rhamnogalacturonan acetylesterase [Chitinophagaceae bacterium]
MQMKFLSILVYSLLLTLQQPKKKIRIWLIGDSTMSVKNVKAYPETGWGMPFVYFWDTTVTVENRAMNGRSTRTFLEENRWQPVVNELQQGDYVLIQFGHNDEVPTKKSYVPEKDFKKNLEKYISDTKDKMAIPVLITPVARRKFDSTGFIQETHPVYAQLVRDVAKENNVYLVDLAEKSKQLFQQLGPEASVYLLNYLEPGVHPNYPNGKKDDTHFNELGARKIAELVLAEIRHLKLELADRIIQTK